MSATETGDKHKQEKKSGKKKSRTVGTKTKDKTQTGEKLHAA